MHRYTSQAEPLHCPPAEIGILLTNLGTPAAPTTSAVRRYLAEFLADPRVVEQPRWRWLPILHGIILRTRPPRVARAYREIWSEEGAPLLVTSQQQRELLQTALTPLIPTRLHISLGMRYGEPSIASGLQQLRQAGTKRILVLPLYPQYSATTTASTFDAVSKELQQWRWVPELRFINHYHDHPSYIRALAKSIENAWQTHGRPEKLLFSFHGLPQRYADAGDPYPEACRQTAMRVAAHLQLEQSQWQLTFQSRFGPEPWLQPYTDHTLTQLGKQGIRHVQLICPGFAADCLETLEEIDQQNRRIFLQAGGERFYYIPALNTEPLHIQLLSELVTGAIGDWCHSPETTSP